MKTEFSENGTLVIRAESPVETFALRCLGEKLSAQGVDTSWVVFDLNAKAQPSSGTLQLCREEQKKQGGAVARSCKRCGNGPCHNSGLEKLDSDPGYCAVCDCHVTVVGGVAATKKGSKPCFDCPVAGKLLVQWTKGNVPHGR